jgi:WD40 repeat protein
MLRGLQLRTLRDHESWVYALAYSPDGNILTSDGVDGGLRIYEAQPRFAFDKISNSASTKEEARE